MNAAHERRHFRPDIQGLRAVAVVLVVLDHAFHWPTGGFVGVDVFYVISGFLITGLLIRELEKSGSVSLRAFYARRIRRIVPAAALVLAVTTIGAALVWYAPRALQVLIDAVSALFFVANWHFVAVGADYLQADGPVSPIQHYWSLSIEEQFYAVWPLLLLATFLVFKSKRAIGVIVIVGLIVSLVASAYLTAIGPAAAYFNTFGRAWELFAGALIAVTGSASARIPVSTRQLLAIIGLVMIIGSGVIVGSSWAVPFPWVGPAVFGAALVIWSAAPAGRWSLLGNPVSRWLGNISYSLYLWHFPVLIFATAILGDTVWIALMCIPVMLLLAHLSYRFVELPVMKSRFLSRSARATNRRRIEPRDLAVGVAALALIGVLAVGQVKGPAPVRSATALASHLVSLTPSESQPSPVTPGQRAEQVDAAIDATVWPASTKSELDLLYEVQQPTAMRMDGSGCRQNVFDRSDPRICDLAQGDRGAALLLGDSIALSWAPAVTYAAEGNGWTLRAMGFGNCSLVEIALRNGNDDPGFATACERKREAMFDLVDAEQPEVVFISASESVMQYTGLPASETDDAWQAAVEQTLERLAAGGVRDVYIITNPPLTKDAMECSTRITSPEACLSTVSDNSRAKADAERTAVANTSIGQLIDTEHWFCSNGTCPAFVDDHVLKTDLAHLTAVASTAVGPLMAAAIAP